MAQWLSSYSPNGNIIHGVYPVCLQEHVHHPWGSVAPVHQQVPVVPYTGRVVSRGELEAADVVDAGLHQPVNVLLHADEARLLGGETRLRLHRMEK